MINSGYASYKNDSFVTSKGKPIKFIDVLKNKQIIYIKAKEDADYEYYLSSMKIIINKFNANNTCTLNDCLISIIEEKGWDVQDFKDNTYLSRDLFSKIKNHKIKKLEKKTLVKILIGLQLPKYQRDELLNLNETPLLDSNVNDALFGFILASKMEIDTADELLKELAK